MPKKPYGSGYFGEWIEDEFGLPAYRYTCDQINDPKAISPSHEIWRAKTEHLHEVGNDRLVGVASNYGYIQVRQDEGSPKYLNDHDPTNGTYAGGFGYLTDGKNFISTYYSGKAESFERVFGMGYFRKRVTGHGLTADQIIFAPFGDAPLLVSQVTVSNNRNIPVELRWIEYWGCEMYQFSIKAVIESLVSKQSILELRRELSKRFSHKFTLLDNHTGILATKDFMGYKFIKKLKWAIINFFLATFYRKYSGGRIKPPVKEATAEDTTPPPTFLTTLDTPAESISTSTNAFFGKGGIESPDGILEQLQESLGSAEARNGMLIGREFSLQPGETKSFYFAYGYLPQGFTVEQLISKYSKNVQQLFSATCEKWKKDRIVLKIADEPWVDRELHWHYYYLRGNLTFDSFFKEHILSQGHVYQYIIGFQGAARDPLQHAFPFIYTDPEIVKDILLYTLKTVSPEGQLPYGITGSGMIMPGPFIPSDLELWLLWLASEYVLATRDTRFLDEELKTYPVYGKKAKLASVKDLLMLCYDHLINITGTGTHSLLRLSNGDWNDMVVQGFVPEKKHKSVTKVGESVLNAAMASYVLARYSQLLSSIGEDQKAQNAMNQAENQRNAVIAQWTGTWFKRAWLSEELGWVGIDQFWLEPQPWAIIGGVCDPTMLEILLNSIDQKSRQPSKFGAIQLNPGIQNVSEQPGTGTNGGVWPSINGTLIMALSSVNGDMAWDEWKKNTLSTHAEAYPDIWYGIWSGPDTYNSELAETPGETVAPPPQEFTDKRGSLVESVQINWVDFPVMNMHPHAWPLFNTIHLLGIKFSPEGMEYAPILPKDEYSFSTPLVGIEKSPDGYSGWYHPSVPGTWKIIVELDENEIKTLKVLEINGKEVSITSEGGSIFFSGENTPDIPLRWALKNK
jgi:hypothetical protein